MVLKFCQRGARARSPKWSSRAPGVKRSENRVGQRRRSTPTRSRIARGMDVPRRYPGPRQGAWV